MKWSDHYWALVAGGGLLCLMVVAQVAFGGKG